MKCWRSAASRPILARFWTANGKQAYRARLQELHAELDEARSSGNEQAALKVEEELRFLTREIARAVGLFGRDRKTGSDAERARVRVTNSIKFAVHEDR